MNPLDIPPPHYGPNLSVRGGGPVMVWPNHDDHLHLRIRDSDGYGN